MPTRKHRYMIVLDDYDLELLLIIMKNFKTKQKSKAISHCLKLVYIKLKSEIL